MYPDVDRPSETIIPITNQAAVVITVRTADYIGIAELTHYSESPRWECRVWDRDSGERLCEATFRNEAAARAWLVACVGRRRRKMSDAMGRRPDGPGWYWYEGTFGGHHPADEPVRVFDWNDPDEEAGGLWAAGALMGEYPIEKLPGDFTPLAPPVADVSQLSDGYHTFAELYEHRHTLFAALMYAYAPLAFKTRRNQDGEEWPGWFIAGMETPMGQLSYHMPDEWWDRLPEIREIERNDKYDGHTSADVLQRISWLRDFFQHPDPNPLARVEAELHPPVAAPEPLREALAAVTAERDAWRKSAEELVEEADYLKRVRQQSDAFAIRYAAERDKLRAERDALRKQLSDMEGEL